MIEWFDDAEGSTSIHSAFLLRASRPSNPNALRSNSGTTGRAWLLLTEKDRAGFHSMRLKNMSYIDQVLQLGLAAESLQGLIHDADLVSLGSRG